MLNKVILIGRLVRDPELRYTPNGKAVANFSLAVDRGFKDKETGENQVDFIRIVTWNKQAELCANNLTKGRLVAVEGSIRTGSYEKDGQKLYTTDIQAIRVVFLDWGDKGTSDVESSNNSTTSDQFIAQSLEDEDIPF